MAGIVDYSYTNLARIAATAMANGWLTVYDEGSQERMRIMGVETRSSHCVVINVRRELSNGEASTREI